MRPVEPACPVCNGTGWLRVERELSDPRFGKLEPCECRGDLQAERLRALSGLSGAELGVRLADLSAETGPGTREMLEACRSFIERPAGFLTIWGGVGVGKTSCLYAITNALVRGGAVYVSLHNLLDFVRVWGDLKQRHAQVLVAERMSADEYGYISSRAFALLGPETGLPQESAPAPPAGGNADDAELAVLRTRGADLDWGQGWVVEEMLLTTDLGRFVKLNGGDPRPGTTPDRPE